MRGIAALEHGYNATLTEPVRHLHEHLSDPLVLKLGNSRIPTIVQVVLFVRVKARRHKDEVRLELAQSRYDPITERLAPFRSSRSTWEYREVENSARLICLLTCQLEARAWIEATSVQVHRRKVYVAAVLLVKPRIILC